MADSMASHTALDGAVLWIEGARAYAHGNSTGAVAVFRAFQRAPLGVIASVAWLCAPGDQFPDAKLLMFKSSAIGRRG